MRDGRIHPMVGRLDKIIGSKGGRDRVKDD
jgi:hypothetical protein